MIINPASLLVLFIKPHDIGVRIACKNMIQHPLPTITAAFRNTAKCKAEVLLAFGLSIVSCEMLQ